MTQEELDKIVEKHQHWLKEDCEGWEDMKANLSGANLSSANLSKADLSGADLSWANLSSANLSKADLYGANLSWANLSWAGLSRANLRCANLSDANLSWVNLSLADLRGANLRCANLSDANLSETDLRGAELRGANFYGASLHSTDRFRLGKVLDEPLTGYKKTMEGVVITAEIPVGAIVFCINGSKCRTNKAKITDMCGNEVLHSRHDNSFEYHLGQEIEIKDFNMMYNVECTSGFHFFRTRKEAEEY